LGHREPAGATTTGWQVAATVGQDPGSPISLTPAVTVAVGSSPGRRRAHRPRRRLGRRHRRHLAPL